MSELGNSLPGLGVRRPVLITVANLLIVLAGIAAILGVDVRELPNIDRPVVSVRASLQGASPETMDTEVTSILEGAVASVPGLVNIESASEENNSRIRVEFQPSVDLDAAANDVREAVNRVQPELPENIENLFVVKADDDAQAIVSLAASSSTLSKEELAKRIEKDVAPNLLTISGVAEVRLSGNQQRALRVMLDPAKLASHRVSVGEVIAVLRDARLDVPAGSYESKDTEFIIRAYASVLEPSRVEALFIRDQIRLRDIGVAFYGPEDAESYSLLNGREVIGLEIVRQAGSNTIAIAAAVNQRVAEINDRSDEFTLYVVADSSVFIRGALLEVVYSLLFAMAIVLLVIAVFLGQLRATIIPAVTLPVSLIGTVAAIWLLGFSINLLTLLALVLATGLVVDDAIIVLENIQRLRGLGAKRMAAAVLGTQQVFFAVIATTATLVSVFVPISFIPGQTGQLFREFGMVLAIAVCISSVVALTLCPMLASKLPDLSSENAWIVRSRGPLERFGAYLRSLYFRSLETLCLRRPFIALAVALLIAGAGVVGLRSTNQELLPQEDRGVLRVMLTGPDGTTLSYIDRQSVKMEEILRPYQEMGLIRDISTMVGSYDPNRSLTSATLAPWDERDYSQMELAKEVSKKVQQIPGALAMVRSENSLNVRGGGSGGLEVALTGNNYDEILAAAETLASRLSKDVAAVQSVTVKFDTSQSQLSFNIDRVRSNDLKVPLETIAETLQVMVDRYDVIDLNIDDEAVPVLLGSAKGTINDPGDLLKLYVPNEDRQLVPLSSLVTVQENGVAAQLDRHGQRRAIELDVGLVPGSALGAAMAQITAIADEVLPPDIGLLFRGEAASLNEASYEVAITFVLAILVVFLVLAAQFENIGSALIVIFTVPFGLAAAVFALMLSGQSINLYSQIGLVMLVGLMTKNAILLVEFMDQLRDQGRTVHEAIIEGTGVRLRPLAMTVLSTVVGALPLVLSTGPGAEARAAIGWVIFGGLGLSSLFTLYLTPLGYSLLAPFVKPRSHAGEQLQYELAEAGDLALAEGTGEQDEKVAPQDHATFNESRMQ